MLVCYVSLCIQTMTLIKLLLFAVYINFRTSRVLSKSRTCFAMRCVSRHRELGKVTQLTKVWSETLCNLRVSFELSVFRVVIQVSIQSQQESLQTD